MMRYLTIRAFALGYRVGHPNTPLLSRGWGQSTVALLFAAPHLAGQLVSRLRGA